MILDAREASLFENGWHFRSLFGGDITEEYLCHLNKQVYIVDTSCKKANIRSQEQYIREVNDSRERLLVGLFDSVGKLRGTSGVQFNMQFLRAMLGRDQRLTTFGVFLFSKDPTADRWGQRLIGSTMILLYEEYRISEVFAGIANENLRSIHAFLSVGFRARFSFESYKLYSMNIEDLEVGRWS